MQSFHTLCRVACLLIFVLMAAGCGGGDDDEGEPSNSAPDARAGSDQTVVEGTAVTLDGSASTDSDGTIVSYTWSQVSGTPADISGANSVRATFQAPEVAIDTALVFQLQVEDNDGATATDRVSVTVTDVPVVAPDVRAGSDQTVREGTAVTLDGSASTDSDGAVVSYTWSQVSGTPVDISGANSVRATFQAPDVAADATLVFQLQVEDNDGVTATDRVSVTVTDVPVAELTVSVFGEGTVQIVGEHDLNCDVPQVCHALVPQNTNVVLKALPMAGYAVDNWTGCNSVSDDECTVATNQDKLVSVYFLSTEPLQLKDDVVMFDADRVDQIEDFDINTGLMVMSADADVSDLSIGSVIVSNVIDPNRGFNTYFLRRIRDIQKLPGGVGYIRTVEATLEDVIASGSLSLSSSPQPLKVASYELPTGATWIGPAPGTSPLVQQDGVSRRVEASVGIDLCLEPELCVMGSVRLTIEPDFAMDFGLLKGLKEFKMAVSVTPSAELKIIAKAGVRGEYKHDLPLKLALTPIALGPVVIVPELIPQLRVTASASAGFEPHVTVGFRMTGGAHYKKASGWVSIGDYNPEFDFEIIRAGLEGNVEAAIIAKFATKLYGIAGPFITAGPYVGGEVFTLSPPKGGCNWDYAWYFGANAEFGGELKFLGLGWEYTATLFDFRFIQDEHRNDCDDVDESSAGVSGTTGFFGCVGQ